MRSELPVATKIVSIIVSIAIGGLTWSLPEKFYERPARCTLVEGETGKSAGPLSRDQLFFHVGTAAFVLLYGIPSLIIWCSGILIRAGADFCVEATFNSLVGVGCFLACCLSVHTTWSYSQLISCDLSVFVTYLIVSGLWLLEILLHVGIWVWYFHKATDPPLQLLD